VIDSNLGHILHRLATIHPLQTTTDDNRVKDAYSIAVASSVHHCQCFSTKENKRGRFLWNTVYTVASPF